MLTVNKLKANVKYIEFLKRNNLKISYDGDSFVRNYLVDTLQFKSENIKTIDSEDIYIREFEKKHIAAAFLNFHTKRSSSTITVRNFQPPHQPTNLEDWDL